MRLMRKNWQWALLLLSLAGLLTLLVLFRSFFIESILRPIGLIFWLAWRVVTSVHQAFYWAMVILLGAFLVIRMLPRESLPDQPAPRDPSEKVTNPYLHWLSAFTSAAASLSGLRELQEKLKELSQSFISQTRRMSPKQAEEAIEAKEWPLSDESRSFLRPEQGTSAHPIVKLRLRGAMFVSSLRKNKISKIPGTIRRPIDEILSSMEAKMETDHEHDTFE